MNARLRIAKNTFAQLFGKFITASTTILITFLVVREYQSDFGSLVAILSYVGLFFVLPDFGINAVVVKNIVSNPSEEKSYFKNLLGLRLILSIIVMFLALAILSFTPHPSFVKLNIIIALSIIALQGIFISTGAIFQAKERYDLYTVADIFGAVSTLCLVFLATYANASILFIILAYLTGALVRSLISFYLASFQVGGFGIKFDYKLWQNVFLTSLPVGLILIFSQLNANLDKQIVYLANYSSELGINGQFAASVYGLAYRIFEIGIVLPTFIVNSAFPIMVTRRNLSLDALLAFSKKLGVGLLFLGFACLVIGMFLAPFMVNILGSGEFPQATITIRLLLVGLPIFFLTPLILWLLVILNRQKIVVFIFGLVTLFNISGNLVFVPRFGYNAAALVTILSELLILILMVGALYISLKREKV